MKPWIVALTGRSGCGKSTVSTHYRKLGYTVLDCDLVSREIVMPGTACLQKLVLAFGKEILDESGGLKRQELARKAFSSESSTRLLTSITHPAIIQKLLEQAQRSFASGAKIVFADGAVIVGESFQRYCDRIIVVDAPDDLCVARIMQRDGIDFNAAKQRLGAQMSRDQLCKAADYVIGNHEDLSTLLQQADKVLYALHEERNEERQNI
ncbi:dephospho-CoA kinase [uncultured Ruthenibacterium sp.]|uniref:dephospho-CoA kinase n=1 Tax=uncultured Ruthenibacterium sp. TaxID=1905347 RepID=UPI00349E9BF8